MIKKVLSVVLISTLITPSFSSLATSNTDVKINNPYIAGYPDGDFRPSNSVNRSEIAKMIAVIKNLTKSEPVFKDIGEDFDWARGFIGAAENAGILKGNQNGDFSPYNSLTRAELATIVSRVLNIDGVEREQIDGVDFSDISGHWGEAAIKEIANFGIINGYGDGTFKPDNDVSREEAVKILNSMMNRIPDPLISEKLDSKFSDVASDRWSYGHVLTASGHYKYRVQEDGTDSIIVEDDIEEVITKTSVHTITILNSTELILKGKNLDKLKASDIFVGGKDILSLKVADDGLTATIKLSSALDHGKIANITINIDGNDNYFAVTYELNASKLEVVGGTFSEKLKGQKLSLRLDGKDVSVSFLNSLGYDVTFQATDNGVSANGSVFGIDSPSTTGIIGESLDRNVQKGSYEIYATLTKDGVSIKSEKSVISIIDFNSDVISIDLQSLSFINDSGSGDLFGSSAFNQSSNILVVGEKLSINRIMATIDGRDVVLNASSLTISSDNSAISIEGNELIAKNAGNANITFIVGNSKKTLPFKVVDEKRAVSKVESLDKANTILVDSNKDSFAEIKLTDQFGDPIRVVPSGVTVIYPNFLVQNRKPISLLEQLNGAIDMDGLVSLNLGRGSVSDAAGEIIIKAENGQVLGRISVRTEVFATTSRKLEISSSSNVTADDNNILELGNSDKDSITYVVKGYNEHGTFTKLEDLKDYTIDISNNLKVLDDITDASGKVITNTNSFTLQAISSGDNIELIVKDSSNKQVGRELLTVKAQVVIEKDTVTEVTWLPSKIVLAKNSIDTPISIVDALSIDSSTPSKDAEILNLKVSGDSQSPRRIAFDQSVTGNLRSYNVYLDHNNDGTYSLGSDDIIGSIEMSIEGKGITLVEEAFMVNIADAYANGNVSFKLKSQSGNDLSNHSVKVEGSSKEALKIVEDVNSFRASVHTDMMSGYISTLLTIKENHSTLMSTHFETITKLKTELNSKSDKTDYNNVLEAERKLNLAKSQIDESSKIATFVKNRTDTTDYIVNGVASNKIELNKFKAAEFVQPDANLNRVGSHAYSNGTTNPNSFYNGTTTLNGTLENYKSDASNITVPYPINGNYFSDNSLKGNVVWNNARGNELELSQSNNNFLYLVDKPLYGESHLSGGLDATISINNILGNDDFVAAPQGGYTFKLTTGENDLSISPDRIYYNGLSSGTSVTKSFGAPIPNTYDDGLDGSIDVLTADTVVTHNSELVLFNLNGNGDNQKVNGRYSRSITLGSLVKSSNTWTEFDKDGTYRATTVFIPIRGHCLHYSHGPEGHYTESDTIFDYFQNFTSDSTNSFVLNYYHRYFADPPSSICTYGHVQSKIPFPFDINRKELVKKIPPFGRVHNFKINEYYTDSNGAQGTPLVFNIKATVS